jgi:hypothetical protein
LPLIFSYKSEKPSCGTGNPNNVAPLVSWLVSPAGKNVSGRVFNTLAQRNGYSIAESFTNGPWETKEGENW